MVTAKEKITKKTQSKKNPHRRSDFINDRPEETREAYKIEFDASLRKEDTYWIHKNIWVVIVIPLMFVGIGALLGAFAIETPKTIFQNILVTGTILSIMATVSSPVIAMIIRGLEPNSKRNKDKEKKLAWDIFNEKTGFTKENTASVEQIKIMQTEKFQKALSSYKKKAVEADRYARRNTLKRLNKIERETQKSAVLIVEALRKHKEDKALEQETIELRSKVFGNI